uniref:L1 transposable element RRM domain-containing protein n=1 Tax=Latimeria chalumnae TaxID=7897 RepID=H2ZSP0_LATCH
MCSNMTRRKKQKLNSEFFKGNSEVSSSWNTADSATRHEVQKDSTAGMQNAEILAYMENILEKLNNLTELINTLTNTVEGLKADNKRYWKHFNELEQRTGVIEEEQAKDKKHIVALDAKITSPVQKLDDQENRARRNNLRILGFPEQIEQGKPIQFLQEALPKILELEDGIQLELERAHRTLAPRPGTDQRPHPFIVKFLRYQTKEMIIRKAREKGPLNWEGNKILIFPDLSKELQEKRRGFLEVKKQLRDRGIRYGLFYPAVFKVTWERKDYSYNSPKEVQAFL